jgi:hypothetical protein
VSFLIYVSFPDFVELLYSKSNVGLQKCTSLTSILELNILSDNERSQRLLKPFLCHGSEDKSTIRRLYLDLREDGANPWLDEQNILPGEDWDIEIKKAVKESDAILVCLSSRSVNKEGYLQKEIKFALDVADEKPEGTIFIITVKLDSCELPDRLKHLEWVDGLDEKGYAKIIRSLRKRAESLGLQTLPGDGFSERVDRPTEVESGKLLYRSRNIRELLRRFKNGTILDSDVPTLSQDTVVGITVEALEEALSPFQSAERREAEKANILRLVGIVQPYNEWLSKNAKVHAFRNSPEGSDFLDIEMIEVFSSNIAAIGYSTTNETLRVAFHSGSVYEYYQVPTYLFDGLRNAYSKGTYLNTNIKAREYPYKQIQ